MDKITEVVREISSSMTKITSSTVYVGIIDVFGEVHYIDEEVLSNGDEDFPISREFLSQFVQNNVPQWRVGDHSIPLSRHNIAFFRISDHLIVVLYTREGRVGELISFKPQMKKWVQRITDATAAKDEPQSMKVGVFPVLTETMNRKKKVPLKTGIIFHLCDGKHSIEEISKETKITPVDIREILQVYRKKGWIMFKRRMYATI